MTPTIYQLCRDRGMTSARMMRILDKPHSTLYRWNRDKNIPLRDIVSIARILKTTPHVIMDAFLQGEKGLF